MVALLVVVLCLTVLFAISVVPFMLPWPQHLRWLIVNASIPGPFGYAVPQRSMTLQEVTVEGMEPLRDGIIIRLRSPLASSAQLVKWVPAASEVAKRVHQWTAAGTPLLLISTTDGDQTLHSRTQCVTGLRNVVVSGVRPGEMIGTNAPMARPSTVAHQ
jgi:hypothetical protein